MEILCIVTHLCQKTAVIMNSKRLPVAHRTWILPGSSFFYFLRKDNCEQAGNKL